MIIVGAGMAGLLAANMLRRHNPVIFEKAEKIPNNHSAVLRFRSSIVGDTLGIPFRKVNMIKTSVPWKNPVADALMYSHKNIGVWRSDRSITSGLVSEVRYIAPPNLIQQMADLANCKMTFGRDFDFREFLRVFADVGPIISTIPMPFLMNALDYEGADWFTWSSGFTLKARIKDSDAYVSLLVPSPVYPFTRISITGDELFVEAHHHSEEITIDHVSFLLGIDVENFYDIQVKPQKFSKINPVNDETRKTFMHWATVNCNIYSLGRFATWRPGLLLDDLVNDVRLIEKWIGRESKHEVAKAS